MATGSRTALGKIGKALEAVAPEETPLQAETRRVVQRLAVAGVFLCVVVAILYGLIWGHWLDSFLASLTLAMAIIPTSFRWC
jgi:Ca2+-transporting ATPase